jgi:MarR family transcriptional regulator, temperature-dependent positive regulator of motility
MATKNHLMRSPLHLLHRASQLVEDLFAASVGNQHQVTPRQFMMLLFIADRPGLSLTELVQATGVDRTTVADLIVRLHQRGLVRRDRSDRDARAYTLSLTPVGEDLLNAIAPLSRRLDDRILEISGPRGREVLEALESIVHRLGAQPATDNLRAPFKPPLTVDRTGCRSPRGSGRR